MDHPIIPLRHPEPLEVYNSVNRIREFGVDLLAIAAIGLLAVATGVALIIVKVLLGLGIIALIIGLPTLAVGALGWRLAALDYAHLDRAQLALKRIISINSHFGSATRTDAGLLDLALVEAIKSAQQLDSLMQGFPAPGEFDQLMAQFKTTAQYKRLRTKRRIYAALTVVSGVLASFWVVTHWSN